MLILVAEPDPEVMAKCNVCYQNPCEHDGVCELNGYKNFTCKCTPGYHGNRCQHEINACFGNPCHNEGKCQILDQKNLFGSFK